MERANNGALIRRWIHASFEFEIERADIELVGIKWMPLKTGSPMRSPRRGSTGGRWVLLLLVLGCAIASCGDSVPATRVLFIGNSYTASNQLPEMVAAMSASVDRTVEVAMSAPGGWWWRDHLASPETTALIKDGDWDFVVLQEQSMAPAASNLAREVSYPAALQLSTLASGSGAEVVLFMTWGHAAGSGDLGYADFGSMQSAIATTYLAFGDALAAEVAAVGAAWWLSLAERPDIVLYEPDGSHPSVDGTYLAAAVLTATILDVDATSLGEIDGVDEEVAEALRGFAARVVAGETPWQPRP